MLVNAAVRGGEACAAHTRNFPQASFWQSTPAQQTSALYYYHSSICQIAAQYDKCTRMRASRMSRGGCCGMTNADWLISPPAAQILPGLLRERVRMEKIKETERVRIPSLPAFFL